MQFTARALTIAQQIETVRVEAADIGAARRELERMKLQVLSIGAEQGAAAKRSSSFAVTLFAQELAALLDAGLSVVEALEGMHDKEASSHGKVVVARLLERLRDGQRLSAALRDQGERFPALFTGLVQAAEQTSDLPRALGRYVDYAQRLELVRSRVISASIYPALLLVVGGAVCLFLMGYVVPRFAQVYQGSGRALPWMSQLLLDWGHWVATHGGVALSGSVSIVAALALALDRARRTGALMTFAAQLPGIGSQLRLLELSRLYLTLGTLLEGGLSIRAAMEMAAATSSMSMQRALVGLLDEVTQGRSISAALQSNGLSTSIAARLLRVGERTGQLGSMFMRAAHFHEAEVARTVERFSRVFEPLLMTAIGLVIGLIVILLYMPIFDLVGSFG
jgi:general secretion pathway protein F